IGAGSDLSQFWWEWMQTGNSHAGSEIDQTSINFGGFDQGIMSVGGDVSISAGGNITNLAASVPTTWYLSGNDSVVNTVGGGNLSVTAGGDILSGDYFVAQGMGTLSAGGKIASSGITQTVITSEANQVPVSTLLATQDGVFNVSARQGVDLAGIVNPSYIQGAMLAFGYGVTVDSQSYSPA